MNLRLAPPSGHKILVVGGCGGIGRSLVDMALAEGLDVAVIDRPSAHRQCPLPESVICHELDATDAAQVKQAIDSLGEQWGRLDGLVNLAGYMADKHPVDEFPVSAWQDVFAASFESTLNCCRHALPWLRRSTRLASIVNMSSGLADVSNPGYGPYSAAKAAIVSLTKTLARENAPNLRVNCVSPGGIATRFLTGGTGRPDSPARIDEQAYAKLVPLARIGTPDEVAQPILFLLSDAARYITGQVLPINGGALMP